MTAAIPDPASREQRLGAIADEIDTAVREGNARKLTEFLTEVGQVLGMDVVFASQVVHDRRVFRCVSAQGPFEVPVAAGLSDALIETYCRLIIDGRLPPIVHDTTARPDLMALDVTRKLRIAAYIGVPIVLADGSVFGTLCCISHSPRRDLLDSDTAALRLIAHAIAGSVVDGEIQGGIWATI